MLAVARGHFHRGKQNLSQTERKHIRSGLEERDYSLADRSRSTRIEPVHIARIVAVLNRRRRRANLLDYLDTFLANHELRKVHGVRARCLEYRRAAAQKRQTQKHRRSVHGPSLSHG